MSDYYEDEWYGDDDDEPEVAETSHSAYLHKAANGHLYTSDAYGWCYWGQDWGETVDQWEITYYRLSEIRPEIRALAIELGRDMLPGTTQDFAWWYYLCDCGERLNDDDLCPACDVTPPCPSDESEVAQ